MKVRNSNDRRNKVFFQRTITNSRMNPNLDQSTSLSIGERGESESYSEDNAAFLVDSPNSSSSIRPIGYDGMKKDNKFSREQDGTDEYARERSEGGFESLRSMSWSTWREVLTILVITALFNADQLLLAPNMSQVAQYFNLTEEEKNTLVGGLIPFLFFTVGAISSILSGFLLNYLDKVTFLFWLVFLGSIPAVACVFVTTFDQLLVFRTLTGISIGGSYPIIYALMAEKATPQTRAILTSLTSLAMVKSLSFSILSILSNLSITISICISN